MSNSGLLANLCRVCLQAPKLGDQLDVGLICDHDDDLSYGDCFKALTNIDLSLDIAAGEPQKLCKTCGLELQMAYDFHKKVAHAKVQIEQYLQTQSTATDEQRSTDSIDGDEAVEEAELAQAAAEDVALYEEGVADKTPTKADAMENVNDKSDFFEVVSEVTEDCDYLVEDNHMDLVEELETIEEYDSADAEGKFTIDVAAPTVDDINSRDATQNVVEFFVDDFIVADDSRQQDDFIEEDPADGGMVQFDCSDAADDNSDEATCSVTTRPSARSGIRIMGPIACDVCHKQFPNHSKMRWHQRMHDTNRMVYKCPAADCDKFYASKQSANIHYKQTHLAQGVVCPICAKRFAIPQTLDVHMRYHTKDYPYACHVCNKKFAQKGHLTTHMQVKHNNLRYVCSVVGCGKIFKNSMSLRNHRFLHTEMPFRCAYCDRGYPQKSKLKTHIIIKHNIDLSLDDLETMRKFKETRTRHSFVKLETLPLNVDGEIIGDFIEISTTKVS